MPIYASITFHTPQQPAITGPVSGPKRILKSPIKKKPEPSKPPQKPEFRKPELPGKAETPKILREPKEKILEKKPIEIQPQQEKIKREKSRNLDLNTRRVEKEIDRLKKQRDEQIRKLEEAEQEKIKKEQQKINRQKSIMADLEQDKERIENKFNINIERLEKKKNQFKDRSIDTQASIADYIRMIATSIKGNAYAKF